MIQRMIAAHPRDRQLLDSTREIEQFRSLATKIFRARRVDGREVKSIAVTSCEPRAGVTSTVAKLAIAAAQQLPRVIALQFERPYNALELLLGYGQASKLPLDAAQRSGISDELITRTQRDNILLARIDRHGSPSNCALKSDEMLDKLLIGENVLIADLPPIADETATLSVLSKFDGVLLIVQAEHTRRLELRRVHEQLQRLHANVVGVVFNNSDD